MSLPTFLTPDAQDDIDAATAWYESIQVGTGDPFLADFFAVLASIGQMPEIFGILHRRTRAAPLAHHKYNIYYRVESDKVIITAVQHASADPKKWQRRR